MDNSSTLTSSTTLGSLADSRQDYGVFVSDIARGVTDEQLKEEFSKIGEVSEAVVVRNKHSGETKGYGFVKFYSISDVYTAIDSSNAPSFKDSISGKMQTVKITLADSKNTLYIGHIPKGLTEDEIKVELEDISGVQIKSFEFADGIQKQYGYAFFKDHDSTIKAIKLIQKSKYTAQLTPSNGLPVGATKVLFARGIKSQSEGDQLRKQLGYDLIEKVIVPLDQLKNIPIGHAFIYCNTTADAKTIMEKYTSLDFQGRNITITWGLPKQKKMEGGYSYGSAGHLPPHHHHHHHPNTGYPHDYPYFLPNAYPDYYYTPFGSPFIDPRRSGYGKNTSASPSSYTDHHHHHHQIPPPSGGKRGGGSDYYSHMLPTGPYSKSAYGGGYGSLYPPRGDYKTPSTGASKPPPGKYRYNPY